MSPSDGSAQSRLAAFQARGATKILRPDQHRPALLDVAGHGTQDDKLAHPYFWHFGHTNVAVLPVLIFSTAVPHSGQGWPSL